MGTETLLGAKPGYVSSLAFHHRENLIVLQPGTYDALTHLLFQPLPTPGSSGGPIIDEETGAVVGMIVGTRMDNRIDGVRGWGRPAESIFEVSVCSSSRRREWGDVFNDFLDVQSSGIEFAGELNY